MHFRDNTDRDGKQNQDVDGSAAHEVIEVDGAHEVSLEDHGRRPLSTYRRFSCHPYAYGLPPKQEPLSNLGHNAKERDGS